MVTKGKKSTLSKVGKAVKTAAKKVQKNVVEPVAKALGAKGKKTTAKSGTAKKAGASRTTKTKKTTTKKTAAKSK